ncbi:serine/threonine-protein kinase [Ammonicoccus fulvus]|uniref:Serine/threonine-protein kinase n=1 Tax=Ammonicoccus fulvus TaxID=3138240 RepID=A0ABZ3FPE2_9ACTN
MSPDLLAGRYELTERIASGGMGHVWRGRDRILERIVAIKTVDLAAQDDTARERFRREAVATAGLSAPNIVQVYDAGIDGTMAYLVMELLTGPTLSRVIHDHGPLDIQTGLQVAREVALALLSAHHIGVVHRDIKPGNVMFHDNQVKLVDFGIAQLARNMGAALTAPATALGTAAYMSPEQATGEGATDKSDWYAFGCLLMTIFTGEPPFKGEALAVASQQINSKPPYVSDRRHDAPAALDQLVARLLEKEPVDRPTGQEVVDQLRLLEVDPNAGTVLMPVTAPAPTSILPPSVPDDPSPYRRSFAESPSEPVPARPAPVVPAPPPPPQRAVVPDRSYRKKKSAWPIVVVLLLILALGLAGAYLLLGDRTPGTVAATATPTVTRVTTTARPPTTRRAPTPTRPATTQPTATRSAAASTPGFTPTAGDTGKAEASAAVESAIGQVESGTARSILEPMWVSARITGDAKQFLDMNDQLEKQSLITKSENKSIEDAVKDWENA